MENIFAGCYMKLSPGAEIQVRALDDIVRNIELIAKRHDDVNSQLGFDYIMSKIFEACDEKSFRLWNDFKNEEIKLQEAKNAKIRHLNEKRLKKINELNEDNKKKSVSLSNQKLNRFLEPKK